MTSIESLYATWLDQRQKAGLKRELSQPVRPDARTLVHDGKTYLNAASNDYLGLSFHPELISRAREWVSRWGAGCGASRLVTGNSEAIAAVESKLAAFKQAPAALVLASGFQANASVLAALLDRTILGCEPLVLADRLNHSSMHFGLAAAGVRQVRYRHCDAAHLAQLLEQHEGDSRPKVILSETVFSMDGDIAPLDELIRLARRHSAMLVLDDAHATGILGEAGRGLSAGADVTIGTFSKAMGGFGAYVTCSPLVRDYLINRCTGLIYSTGLPPAVWGAIDAALDVMPSLDGERQRVAAMSARLRTGLSAMGFDTGASATQIVPMMIGEERAALAMAERLRAGGVWATAIRPPTVPKGTARIRFALSAALADDDIETILHVIREAASALPPRAA
ncbi:MAG: aminotransferase class I/II-fold pyridoxal phosphate-dependent enzyme [Hyphomicrobiaceae bacterium]